MLHKVIGKIAASKKHLLPLLFFWKDRIYVSFSSLPCSKYLGGGRFIRQNEKENISVPLSDMQGRAVHAASYIEAYVVTNSVAGSDFDGIICRN